MRERLEYGEQKGLRRDVKPLQAISKEEQQRKEKARAAEQAEFSRFMSRRANLTEKGALMPQNLKTTESAVLNMIAVAPAEEDSDSGLEFDGPAESEFKSIREQIGVKQSFAQRFGRHTSDGQAI